MHARYNGIVAVGTRDMGQWATSEDGLSSLQSRVKKFEKMLLEAFDEHCDLGLYTLMYHLLNYVVDNIQIVGTLSVLESCSHEHSNVLIMRA